MSSRSDFVAGVPALTLLNPWAHLIAHHGKDVENRTWVPGTATRLLIHAGKGWDWAAAERYGRWLGPGVGVTSAVVAVAIIDDVCSATVNAPGVVCRCGSWAQPGLYHWRLRSVVALAEPVPAQGRLRLWYPPAEVVEAIEIQLAAVTP